MIIKTFINFTIVLLIAALNFVPAQNFNKLINDINVNKYGKIEAVVIANPDSILFESYFNGFKRDSLHKCYSITKSITSLLFGARDVKNLPPDIKNKLASYYPEYTPVFQSDSQKFNITLNHLFTMTAGFEWKQFAGVPPEIAKSDDVLEALLQIKLDSKPGTKFTYNSGVTVLLGNILERITKTKFEDFLKSKLFDKLKIENYKLEYLANTIANTGSGLSMQAIDLIKIGQMLLKNGGELIDPDWIRLSTQKHVERGSHSDYAFQWWRYDMKNEIATALKNDVYFASGHAGQFLWVIPHSQITVLVFSDNIKNPKLPHLLFKEHIVPMLK